MQVCEKCSGTLIKKENGYKCENCGLNHPFQVIPSNAAYTPVCKKCSRILRPNHGTMPLTFQCVDCAINYKSQEVFQTDKSSKDFNVEIRTCISMIIKMSDDCHDLSEFRTALKGMLFVLDLVREKNDP